MLVLQQRRGILLLHAVHRDRSALRGIAHPYDAVCVGARACACEDERASDWGAGTTEG